MRGRLLFSSVTDDDVVGGLQYLVDVVVGRGSIGGPLWGHTMQRSDSGRVSCPVNGSTPRRASARAAARASASGVRAGMRPFADP